MISKDEALKMAIKEIESWIDHAYGHTPEQCADNEAIKACKEALKSQEQKSVYIHPIKKLNEDEIHKIYAEFPFGNPSIVDIIRATEKAHGIGDKE